MSGFLRTRSSPPLLCHSYKRNFPVVKVKIFPFSRDRVSANGEWSPTEFTKEGGCRFSFSKGGQENKQKRLVNSSHCKEEGEKKELI